MGVILHKSCDECAAEANASFILGDSYDRNGSFTEAIRQYDKALSSGYNDRYGLCQTMIIAGINMGVLEQKTAKGIPDVREKATDYPADVLSMLEEAIELSKQYLH